MHLFKAMFNIEIKVQECDPEFRRYAPRRDILRQ